MLWVPKSLLTARSWTRCRERQQRSRNVRSCRGRVWEPGPSPLLQPAPKPRQGCTCCSKYQPCTVQTLPSASRAIRTGECRCHQPPPVQALQADLNPRPPKAGQAIYNAFNISLFSANNTCSKSKSKAYFALPDDLRPSHDLLHCYRC